MRKILLDKLSLDLQVFMYLSAIRDIYGEQPVGVIYNIIRRPQERLGKKETIQEFAARVGEKVRQDPGHYFLRMNAAVLPSEIEEYERDIFDPIMRQLADWWEGNFHYKNPTSCNSGFYPCTFLPLCGRGVKDHYRKRDALFSELTMTPLKMR